MVVQPIVEGQGDEAATPILLRRLAAAAEAWNVQIARPHRRRRNQLSRMADFQNAVRVALLTPDCTGVLILFDADDDCPRECAPEFEAWAREASRDVPSAVVMANHEYEAWFLASMKSLRETRHVRADAVDHPEPERPRDAKEEMKKRMEGGRYLETAHQAPLTASLDLAAAYRHCRSFPEARQGLRPAARSRRHAVNAVATGRVDGPLNAHPADARGVTRRGRAGIRAILRVWPSRRRGGRRARRGARGRQWHSDDGRVRRG